MRIFSRMQLEPPSNCMNQKINTQPTNTPIGWILIGTTKQIPASKQMPAERCSEMTLYLLSHVEFPSSRWIPESDLHKLPELLKNV